MESLRNVIKLRYLLAVVMLSVLAAIACSSDPTATAELPPTPPPVTQTPSGSEGGDVAMLQLPNIADTVERVRPAVVSIVTRIVSRDRFGR
jgi:S1-C subfamily serine protease